MNKGKFIVLEGIDGSGKTTQAKLLCDELNFINYKSQLSCEPTDRPMGKLLREYLKGGQDAFGIAVAGLFTADRLDHLTHKGGVIDTVESGVNVISDRYYFSSYAYNAHDFPVEQIIELNSTCSALKKPDLNIYIDISPETAMKRINENRSPDQKELYETAEYLKKVRSRYMKAIDLLADCENIVIIDGEDTPENVHKKIMETVYLLFEL